MYILFFLIIFCATSVSGMNNFKHSPKLEPRLQLCLEELQYNELKEWLKEKNNQEYIQNEKHLFYWVIKQTNDHCMIKLLIGNGMKEPKFFLEGYLKNLQYNELEEWLKEKDNQKYIQNEKSLFPWVIKQTSNHRMIELLIDYGMKKSKFYLQGYQKNLQYNELKECLEEKNNQEYIKDEKSLSPWILEQTDNPRMIEPFIDNGMKEPKFYLEGYLKKLQYDELEEWLKEKDNQKYIQNEKSLFYWVIKQTNDHRMIELLIDNGMKKPKSHLQGYLKNLQYNELKEWLKEKDNQEYIQNEKSLFPWILEQTDNPLMIKLLIDNGINLDYRSKLKKKTIFHLITRNSRLINDDIMIPLIARFITGKEVDLLNISKILEEKDYKDKIAYKKAYKKEAKCLETYGRPHFHIDPLVEIILQDKDPEYLNNEMHSVIDYNNSVITQQKFNIFKNKVPQLKSIHELSEENKKKKAPIKINPTFATRLLDKDKWHKRSIAKKTNIKVLKKIMLYRANHDYDNLLPKYCTSSNIIDVREIENGDTSTTEHAFLTNFYDIIESVVKHDTSLQDL